MRLFGEVIFQMHTFVSLAPAKKKPSELIIEESKVKRYNFAMAFKQVEE